MFTFIRYFSRIFLILARGSFIFELNEINVTQKVSSWEDDENVKGWLVDS